MAPCFITGIELSQRLGWSLTAGSCAGYGTMGLLFGSSCDRIECGIIGGLSSAKVRG